MATLGQWINSDTTLYTGTKTSVQLNVPVVLKPQLVLILTSFCLFWTLFFVSYGSERKCFLMPPLGNHGYCSPFKCLPLIFITAPLPLPAPPHPAPPLDSLVPLQSRRIILSHTRCIIIRPCTEFPDNAYSLFSVLIPYQMHRSRSALTDLGRLSGEQR